MIKITANNASSIYLCITIVKRITAILLLLIYTAAVAGVRVSGFYCCGKLRSTTVSPMAFAKSTANDDGCCKHKQAVLKVNDTHEGTGLAKLSAAKSILLHVFYPNPANIIATNYLACAISNPVNGPPLRPQTPLYIQYCNYRI